MVYFRLIKPAWGKKTITKKVGGNVTNVPNPELVREIEGPNTHEGYFEPEFVRRKNEDGYNVYYFPNSPSRIAPGTKFVSGKDIDTYDWVFVDCDLKDGVYASKEAFIEELERFAVPPTQVVASGNGVHAYWRIDDLEFDRDFYMALQFMLIQHFNTDASIWTPLQLMRYPGTLNTKDPENFKRTEIVANVSSGKHYKLEDLLAHLPTISPENRKKAEDHVAKLMGLYQPVLSSTESLIDGLPEKFEKLMERDEYIAGLFHDPVGTYGDRSKADFALTNHLFSNDFTREEALQVLFNTEKARSRSGGSRTSYAATAIDKVYGERSVHSAMSVDELMKEGSVVDLGDPVSGPQFLDCLGSKWRKKQILGLIAPPGGGKTSLTLKIFKEFIQQNPHNDDLFLFFSLEMPAGQIIERWLKLTKDMPEAKNRLCLATNWLSDGTRRHINLQDIVQISKDTMKRTGKKIGAIVIDHLAMLNPVIDTRKSPNFGHVEASSFGRRGGSTVRLDVQQMCMTLAEIVQTLDCFLIVQSQTTKEKAGAGDKPLQMNAAFGASAFEWICDYVVTCWQPLLKVYKDTPLRVLAWQYCKIREIREDDQVQRGQQCLVAYQPGDGDMRPLSDAEYSTAQEWLGKIKELNREAAKSGMSLDLSYTNSPEFKAMHMILGGKL